MTNSSEKCQTDLQTDEQTDKVDFIGPCLEWTSKKTSMFVL